MTLCNKHYYRGVVGSYEQDLKRLYDVGVQFKCARLNQFKNMLLDYTQMEDALRNIASLSITDVHLAIQIARTALAADPRN